MHEIEIKTLNTQEILTVLCLSLQGEISEKWGESFLCFDNEFGNGTIRHISFDWGISLLDYNVCFTKDVKLIFNPKEVYPVQFIFVSQGNLQYTNEQRKEKQQFERYQNIIISNKKNHIETFIFPGGTNIKVNFIYLEPEKYERKKNNNLSNLNGSLLKTLNDRSGQSIYQHFGNFNLKIADHIKRLHPRTEPGIVRTLAIEGQLNLILALQILEYNNYESGKVLPDSISKDDIQKIHNISNYILENISDPMTVTNLALRAGLNPKKLQLGFNVMYSKSVNEYIRELKLEVARDAIKNSNDSISEIVYNIGFKSRSYFSKIFYQKYGVLPTEYRKKNKITKN